MKASGFASTLLQLAFIILLSASGVYAFSKYSLGMLLLEFLCNQFNHLMISYEIPFFSSYTVDPQAALTILMILLCTWGTRSITMKGGDGKRFTSSIGLLVFPSVLNYSYIGWSTWFNYLSGASSNFFETQLSFYECTLFMISIIIGLLTFRFIAMFREDKTDLLTRGGEEDVEKVFAGAHIYMSLSMSGILLILTIFLTPLTLINNFTYYLIENLPVGLMALGITFSLLILTSIYFFIKKAYTETPTKPQQAQDED